MGSIDSVMKVYDTWVREDKTLQNAREFCKNRGFCRQKPILLTKNKYKTIKDPLTEPAATRLAKMFGVSLGC